jgi:predicted methyltransferase
MKKEQITKKAAIIATLFFMVGCSANKRVVDCSAGVGMECKSISKVNKAVNEGKIKDDYEVDQNKKNHKSREKTLTYQASNANSYSKSGAFVSRVIRKPEKVIRIWMNSFENKKGDYIEETYVHAVLEKGSWEEESRVK